MYSDRAIACLDKPVGARPGTLAAKPTILANTLVSTSNLDGAGIAIGKDARAPIVEDDHFVMLALSIVRRIVQLEQHDAFHTGLFTKDVVASFG